MANINAPFGLRYLGNGGGASPNSELRELSNGILYSNSEKIYFGDLVRMQESGYLAQWDASTPVSHLWGVFAGCKFAMLTPPEKKFSRFWPGANAREGTVKAFFYPAALALPGEFVIQTDATGITQASIGANADIAVGSGNDLNGTSGSYLDTTTIESTATLPLKIVDLWANRAPAGSDGTEAGAYNWAVVRLNVYGNTGFDS